MPRSKSVSKTARLAERKRLRNRSVRSGVKTRIAKAEKLATSKSESADAGSYQLTAISSIDKAVSKGVFHRNKGARLKSRLMKKLSAGTAVSQSSDSEQGKGEVAEAEAEAEAEEQS